ncbi:MULTISPECIES: TIGR03943 family protein [unclassified Kitasatospora]|uniref:TIGR03943 family putative permease subunit n=1 Tax=unclassified Kitasatospora TaxID=2633591 RepID=UPI0007100E08|nr:MULTISPECIES: TIGR03943 family protein [unclassified Kitasatospora]KQV04435.1 hypothetical protein ASC99_13555 [Kitasatospora sp. Root107]KRB61034.1 hypothetical protein ASE03_11940 [Kitasatospora sp. Root187]
MRKLTYPALLALLGAALLRITVGSEIYLRYVKESLHPLVMLSGAVLLGLGLTGLARELRALLRQPVHHYRRDEHGAYQVEAHAAEHDDEDEHGHSHGAGPRIAWLLGAPALALLLFAPPALGAYTANRDGAAATVELADYRELATGPVTPMSMSEFIGRSLHDSGSLTDRQVLLTGFVTKGGAGTDWHLNRLTVSCCAADARPLRVAIHGKEAPTLNSWVEVTGRWRFAQLDNRSPVPHLDVLEVRTVPAPRNPYADRAPVVALP